MTDPQQPPLPDETRAGAGAGAGSGSAGAGSGSAGAGSGSAGAGAGVPAPGTAASGPLAPGTAASGPAAPGFTAPASGFTAPAGYAPPPGVLPAAGFGRPPVAARTRTLGVVALVLAVVATVGATIVGAIAGFQIRAGADLDPLMNGSADLAALSPVRAWVLTGELAFWIGTALGVLGLVLGVIAIATRRGIGWGIGAVVAAALGPVLFFALLTVALSAAA
ncbi:hypothetical protein N3K63_09830 [Microbacterium sp. W1N]|uniref:hypothetical protein n=1 Tax=Microbacterium festucae TaxID=2977531 RepID=UPI0021C240BD|nr:hypothetical protein [Microbacterium festucae]MCT9820580.1 hypothetical protein [Microbacterium festucae]